MDFEKYYTDPSFSGSFSGVDTFYRALKKIDSKVKRSEVQEYLKSASTYTLHKPVKRPKSFRRVYIKGLKYLFQIDLIDVPKYSNENDGLRYLITLINCFSKYAWVFPTKSKQGKVVCDAVRDVLKSQMPLKIQSDHGNEFYNSHFKSLMTELNITHYSTESYLKASIIERFNRTLKTRLERVFTFQGNHRFVEVLPRIVEAYNSSYHRSIGMAPCNVTLENSEEVMRKLYPKHTIIDGKRSLQKPTAKSKFKAGDVVRITQQKHIFQKGFEHNWSFEIFKVLKVLDTTPITYELLDYINRDIKGSFYESELQSVTSESLPVEKVVKTRKRRGKTEYLIKFQGYPEEANIWLTQEDLLTHAN